MVKEKNIIMKMENYNSKVKRNGKGKEYYENGKTKFEGLYNNGRIWSGIKYDLMNNKVYELKNGSGVIKDYDLNDILIVEGDYLNGEINGKVKEYVFGGQIKFEGEYLNGKRHGKGKNIINMINYI